MKLLILSRSLRAYPNWG